jgi:hypothetical protein
LPATFKDVIAPTLVITMDIFFADRLSNHARFPASQNGADIIKTSAIKPKDVDPHATSNCQRKTSAAAVTGGQTLPLNIRLPIFYRPEVRS